jgi:phenylacetate-CoA ligase
LAESTDYWNVLSRVSELCWTRWQGADEIRRVQRKRIGELVAFARAQSPAYRELYGDLPEGNVELARLPPVTKRELMRRFDDWVVDPGIDRESVDGFTRDPGRIGELLFGRYAVWKSSGSTGEPGVFLHDVDALATYDGLIASQVQSPTVAGPYAFGVLAHAGRAALIAATGEHFASISSWQRLARASRRALTLELSVMQPQEEWVAELNRFQPAFLASYPTALLLLAAEQDAGRLRVSPTIVWSGGEHLTEAARRTIGRAFGCLVINEYGTSECLSIAFGCNAGWLHVNADWVVLEPVDREYRPVAPGKVSHTALLTNLANRVQPIIRYDIGDRVVVKATPCACGSALPAIRVDGRCDDTVALRRPDGEFVKLLPMALATVVEEASDLHCFQIVQQGDQRLSVRLHEDEPRRRSHAWRAARRALRTLLEHHALPNVRVELDTLPPQIEPHSGKLRQVLARGSAH